jgi:hypothetical protein
MNKPQPIGLSDFPSLMYDRAIPLIDLHKLRKPGLIEKYKENKKTDSNFYHYLNYWRRNDLLPFIEKGKWGKLNFIQLIWIQILESMREFGLSIEIMKNVCDYFFKDSYIDNVPKTNLTFTKKILNEKQKTGKISDEETQTLDYINRILSNDKWLTVLKYDINYLTNLVIACINEQWHGGIVIFADGTIAEHINGVFSSHKADFVDPEKPHVYLPIKYYLYTFFDDSELSLMVNPIFLNPDEQSVIREVRKGNISEIIIELEGKKIKRIDSTAKGIITGEKVKEIMKILGLKNYERITVETRNEKTLSVKRTKKNFK